MSILKCNFRFLNIKTNYERMPLLVIDGREVSCEEFERMLRTFEGRQLLMEIGDRSEEV